MLKRGDSSVYQTHHSNGSRSAGTGTGEVFARNMSITFSGNYIPWLCAMLVLEFFGLPVAKIHNHYAGK